MKKIKLFSVVVVLAILLSSVSYISPTRAAPLQAVICTLQSGCIVRESGSANRWWADSWYEGICRGHSEKDWIVTYKVNNDTWKKANQSNVRFYAANWSLAQQIWKTSQVQVEQNNLSRGGGITICVSSLGGLLSPNDVKGTYLWIKP